MLAMAFLLASLQDKSSLTLTTGFIMWVISASIFRYSFLPFLCFFSSLSPRFIRVINYFAVLLMTTYTLMANQ